MIGSREEMKKITDDLQEPVVQNINAVLDGFIDRPLVLSYEEILPVLAHLQSAGVPNEIIYKSS